MVTLVLTLALKGSQLFGNHFCIAAITCALPDNLLHIAGVTHVITIDLHASQMQGFFKCPVDNLIAEPLLARWIRHNIQNWKEAVVVSKNPGGTKRVTSLADALKLSFGIVTTDDKVLSPEFLRWMYGRTATKVTEIKSSHMVYMSHPQETADVILEAVNFEK